MLLSGFLKNYYVCALIQNVQTIHAIRLTFNYMNFSIEIKQIIYFYFCHFFISELAENNMKGDSVRSPAVIDSLDMWCFILCPAIISSFSLVILFIIHNFVCISCYVDTHWFCRVKCHIPNFSWKSNTMNTFLHIQKILFTQHYDMY